MAKLSDFRADRWPVIERLLAAGGEPKRDDLLSALDQEKAIPPLAKAHIAALLDGRVKKRGRRAVPLGEIPSHHKFSKREFKKLQEHHLVYSVRKLAKKLNAEKDPTQAAIEQIALVRHVDASTIRRYFLKALARLPEWVAPPLTVHLGSD